MKFFKEKFVWWKSYTKRALVNDDETLRFSNLEKGKSVKSFVNFSLPLNNISGKEIHETGFSRSAGGENKKSKWKINFSEGFLNGFGEEISFVTYTNLWIQSVRYNKIVRSWNRELKGSLRVPACILWLVQPLLYS